MMNKQKAINLLGLAMKAGKVTSGEELVLREIRSNKAKIVIVASDASDNTRKKMQDKCSYYNVPCTTDFTQLEITQAIGRSRMTCSLNDQGFARKFKELIK